TRLQRVDGGGVIQLNLDRGGGHIILLLAATGVAHAANADLLTAEMEMLPRDVHAVGVGVDGGDAVRFRCSSGLVLDLSLHVEWCDAGELDGDGILMLLLFGAELERLPGFRKRGGGLGIDMLLDNERVGRPVYVIEAIGQPVELVGVIASLGGVHRYGSL